MKPTINLFKVLCVLHSSVFKPGVRPVRACDRLDTAAHAPSLLLTFNKLKISTIQCCIYTLPMLEPVLQPAIISFTKIT